MKYTHLDTNLRPYIDTLKSLKLIETDQHYTFFKEFKEVALEIYSTYFHIIDKKKQDESNLIEKIKILLPQITEINIILKKIYSSLESDDIMEVLGVTIPLEESIENLMQMNN